MISKRKEHRCKPCTYLAPRLTLSQMDQNELPLDSRHIGVPLGASKMISWPMVRSAQTVHLSCAEINTISKQTETSFHLTHITYEFEWVCPKRFASLLHVRCKPSIYLVLRLTLSPNGWKHPSTWPMSPRSSIKCTQNDSHAHGTFGTNRAPISRRD
jgi:hypothetical protein